jgi:putative transposase
VLNAKHWAWLSAEYHARRHTTTERIPREHWLAELAFLRTVPRQKQLDDVFLHRERRVVRKDGTVRFGGAYLEVRPDLVGQEVELRFDPRDETTHPRVFIEDRFVCDTVPLDRVRNATRGGTPRFSCSAIWAQRKIFVAYRAGSEMPALFA